ncbi:MAG TPA: hypothetical protein VGJ77_08005 [Gaiellaceae bacterium]
MRRTAGGILFAACLACLLAGAARGGFSWGDGSSVVFGGTPIGIGKSTEDIDKTKTALVDAGLAKDAKQAELQVVQMQDRMLAALKLVKGKDAAVSDTLKAMLRKGTLDVDLVKSGPTDQEGTTVSLIHDGVATPLVNVKSPLLLPPAGASFDVTALVSLALTLYHEGIHVRQEIPDVTETDAHRKEAAQRRDTCKREIEAHGAELDLIKELDTAVTQLKANPDFVPSGVSDFTKGVVEKLKTVDKKEIDKLHRELERQTIGGTLSKNRYTSACEQFEKFLNGTLTWEKLQAAIGKIPRGTSTVFAPLQRKIVLFPISSLVFGVADDAAFVLETPFQQVISLDPVPGRGLLLVSGTAGDELGGVVAYRDADGDGLYDARTLTTVVAPTPALRSGLDLLDLGDEKFYVTDFPSGSIYRLADGNDDGIPDGLGVNIAGGLPIPDSFVTFALAEDGTFFGFDAPLDVSPSFTGDEPTLRLSDTDGDGLLDDTDVAPFSDRLRVEPTVLDPLVPGGMTARIQLNAGSDFWVLAVDRTTGSVRDVLASGFAPSLAPLTVSLDSPLGADEGLVVHDFTHGIIGQATLATPPGAAVHLTLTPLADPISAGEFADFRILATNDGFGPARSVTVSGTVPPVVPWRTDRPGCNVVGGSFTCPLGDLEPGDAEVIHLTTPTDATDCGGTLFIIVGAGSVETPGEEQAASISINC